MSGVRISLGSPQRHEKNCQSLSDWQFFLIVRKRSDSTVKSDLENVMTAAEAGDRWGMTARTIQQACTGYKGGAPRFIKEEARKSGPHLAGNTAGHGVPVWP